MSRQRRVVTAQALRASPRQALRSNQRQDRSPAAYISWLEAQSMLHEAERLAKSVSAAGIQWQRPYALPQTEQAVATASVWFTAYPCATITRRDASILQTLGDKALWQTFQQMGIQAMHTSSLEGKAGGIQGYTYTPTVDGCYDRISLTIDSLFGTEKNYKQMVANAEKCGGLIIGDIIPGHTGKGADFRLAERGYKDYPGLYAMVEIRREDWPLLPEIPKGEDSVNLPTSVVNRLKAKGYIPGRLQRVIFSISDNPDVTNWDATGVVAGADGRKRRWVFLHNLSDGTPAGMF